MENERTGRGGVTSVGGPEALIELRERGKKDVEDRKETITVGSHASRK